MSVFGYDGKPDGTLKRWAPKLRALCNSLIPLETLLAAFGDIKEVTIAADTEAAVEHNLGVVPSGYIIVSSTLPFVADGDTAWTEDKIYLHNRSSSSSVTCKVVIFS